jgi:hypothetical protein
VYVRKGNRFLLFREIVAVCGDNHIEHINKLCGQDAEILLLQHVVHIVTTVLQEVKIMSNCYMDLSLFSI